MSGSGERGGLPLSGVRVLDLGRMISAPWATQLLGDLGAEVIKVERPGRGDDIRGYGPPFLKTPDGADDDSPYHLAMNRNKKSITVDLANPAGQALIRELAKACDVFVENFKPGDLARYGLGYDDLAKINPNLVYCSISGFGHTGPYSSRPGLDVIFQAMTGLMSVTGEPDGAPTKSGSAVCDVTVGLYAAIGILAALREREVRGGGGQHLDMALFDVNLAALGNRAQTYLACGEIPERLGSASPGNHPAGLFRCADGEVILTAGSDPQFRTFARLLGEEAKADDPRFHTRALRVTNAKALDVWIESVMTTRPRAHWLALLQASGLMCAPINTIPEAFDDPQAKARGMVVETPHPRAGAVPLIANPIRFSRTTIPPFTTPPDVGQHTAEVLRDVLGADEVEIQRLRTLGAI